MDVPDMDALQKAMQGKAAADAMATMALCRNRW